MALRVDDCWNRIGAYGDASCPKLAACAHCRNCDVYSAAAAGLLDREIGDERLTEATEAVSRPVQAAAPDAASAVILRLGAEWFALSSLAFDEITEPRSIRQLPHRRDGAVLGLANVRGELVACLSLARVLQLPEADQPPRGRLVLLNHPQGRVAFPVDEVRALHAYAAHEVQPLPATYSETAAGFADGLLAWSGRFVGLLDSVRVAEALHRSLA